MMDNLEALYYTLKLRKRPEDIADMVLAILKKELTPLEISILHKAAKNSLKNKFLGYTSMAQEFSTVVGAEKQVKKTIELFGLNDIGEIDADQIPDVENFIDQVAPFIHKKVGENNFVSDRLNKFEREGLGLDMSKRAYNKRWRLLKRLENKLIRIEREIKKNEFQKIAKHGIVHHLSFEDFSKDKNTACFIAYYNARCNLRSVFTNKKQARAFDEISDMLYKRCNGEKVVYKNIFNVKKIRKFETKTDWWSIAHIYSSRDVLKHLSDEQKGQLLGKWTSIIQEIAQLLGELWNTSSINRKTMIVQRGNDSTTWNHTAGAWNKARDQWMNLIYALGMEFILNEVCFGKVMRLMAADVAAWHQYSGGSLDPNTEVWNKLPLPWEVFNGSKNCNKKLVEKYCKEVGINAEKSGWIAPRKHGIEKYKPTPELVHGVEVANPFLASVLKKHKYFSGKNVKTFYPAYN